MAAQDKSSTAAALKELETAVENATEITLPLEEDHYVSFKLIILRMLHN